MSTGLLFNPSQQSTDELESTFVGRHSLLDRLERDLGRDQKAGTPRHWQIIGPRGSGKSHLTELLARRMAKRHGWRIARLPEENYQVATLGELLEQIVVRSESFPGPSPFAGMMDDRTLQDRAIDRLRGSLLSTKKPLLVVLENLASMLDRQLKSPRDQARLRDILTNNPPFVLVATSTSQSAATMKHSAPLFEFFQTITLDDLERSDIKDLVRARAGWENNSSLLADFERVTGQIDAIYHLSGGNPRLALALYTVVQQGVTSELYDQIMKLLDEVTPYYQARLSDIPPQAARVLTEMAISESVSTPAAIARLCRIPTNQVTAQISKLLDERLVVQGGRPNARSRYYEVKDRLLRIWIQMRESVGAARRLRFLAEFYERWYAGRAEELEVASRRTISDLWTELGEGDPRRCNDRLKTISYLTEIRPGFDHSVVVRAMTRHVGESTQADIRAHVDALRKLFENASDLREREALAFMLAECLKALHVEQEAGTYLKRVLDEDSQSETIAERYMSSLLAAGDYVDGWDFGSRWIADHATHAVLTGVVGVAALGIGKFAEGMKLLSRYTEGHICSHCTERAMRQASMALRKQKAPVSVEVEFWNRFMRGMSTHEATTTQLHAAFDVLVGFNLSKIPTSAFLDAAEAWTPLSDAPVWFLGKSICGLSHRKGHEVDALRFIVALSERNDAPLGQFAVDHLLDILPSLRHASTANKDRFKEYQIAISLVRTRTTPETLGVAFRRAAPGIAKSSPKFVSDLLALFEEWEGQKLIPEGLSLQRSASDTGCPAQGGSSASATS